MKNRILYAVLEPLIEQTCCVRVKFSGSNLSPLDSSLDLGLKLLEAAL
jgi:hypothetical protein